MGSINKSHNETDGGILLFNGELILLFCESVNCEIGGTESVKGRVYLTTHRLVMIVTPYRPNSKVKSLCAPFCAITKCNVEQPIFGANYIEATVRDENDPSASFSFKLKFSKGGAIELAMAMNRAVAAVNRNINPSMQPPPAYSPSPSEQYYQAPPTVYAPGYNSGVQMPVNQFPDQPPIGFIYTSTAPPPYPGLGNNSQAAGHQPPPYSQPQQAPSGGGYPSAGQQQQYPTGYPQQPAGGYQQPAGYPQQPVAGHQQPASYPQQPPSGYPGSAGQPSAYPQQQPSGHPQNPPPSQPNAGYPQQQTSGYPGQVSQPTGYPQPGQQQQQQQQQQPGSGYPGQQPSGAYPDLSQAGNPAGQSQPAAQSGQQASWPSAPSFNPNWQDEKK